jgi:hypothetical protein
MLSRLTASRFFVTPRHLAGADAHPSTFKLLGDFTHTQGEIPVDRQLAAQPLEGSQDATVLTLAKFSHEEQWNLCEQLQLIRDQTNLILNRMDQHDKENDE